MSIKPRQLSCCPDEVVKPQLDDRKDGIDVLEVASRLMRENSFVAIDPEVVVDAKNGDVARQCLEGCEVATPAVGGLAVPSRMRCRRMDVKIPLPPFRTDVAGHVYRLRAAFGRIGSLVAVRRASRLDQSSLAARPS